MQSYITFFSDLRSFMPLHNHTLIPYHKNHNSRVQYVFFWVPHSAWVRPRPRRPSPSPGSPGSQGAAPSPPQSMAEFMVLQWNAIFLFIHIYTNHRSNDIQWYLMISNVMIPSDNVKQCPEPPIVDVFYRTHKNDKVGDGLILFY